MLQTIRKTVMIKLQGATLIQQVGIKSYADYQDLNSQCFDMSGFVEGFVTEKYKSNSAWNRYCDIVCLNMSRLTLHVYQSEEKPERDYLHYHALLLVDTYLVIRSRSGPWRTPCLL